MKCPQSIQDINPRILTGIISQQHPDVRVEKVTILEAKDSDQVDTSSSARVAVEVEYSQGSTPGLPTRLIIKMTMGDDTLWYSKLHAMYANEVNFYTRLRPELDRIEAPLCLGGYFDPVSSRYALILEDLRARNVSFYNNLDNIEVKQVKSVLDTLARLHARFWESPRFDKDLSWVGSHLEGSIEDLMNQTIRQGIQHELKNHKFKREFVNILDMSESELHEGLLAVKRHQATMPQTLVHGDTHPGNLYFLPDGTAGLLDWQIMVKGNPIHDVAYLITMALPVDIRRREELALLGYYRGRLVKYGIATPPDMDALWLEYKRAAIWGIYIGWLTVPAENYGWEISMVAHLRATAAFLDHETATLVRDLL